MAMTISGDGSITGLAVGGLPDNVVDKDTLAVGVQSKVLQVVQGTYSTQASNTTTTLADSGLTATITPSSTSSKILVVVSQALGVSRIDPYHQANLALLRGATTLQTIYKRINYTTSSNNMFSETQSINYLDSPSSISALTYKTQFKCNHGTNTEIAYVNYNGSGATITLMEIGV